MIRVIEALGFRCLRYVRQGLDEFHLLVGPNASGKSAFLDVVRLLGDLLREGLVTAVQKRSPSLMNLVWMQEGTNFEVAVELEIPEERKARLKNGFERARYEVALGLAGHEAVSVLGETLWLAPSAPESGHQRLLFPESQEGPGSLMHDRMHGWKKVVTKKPESGITYFLAETTGWNNPFRLGPRRLGLANLPEDEERFPVSIWVKRVLMEGIQYVALNSDAMRRPAPPGSPAEFQPDGSNLPWAVQHLKTSNKDAFDRWVAHVRTALPDVESVRTVERPEDKHRYLEVAYNTGLKAPSWTVSDGTLRLLALTLIAYLQEQDRVFLIEEPENGIHPKAIETVFQSLSSAYSAQILCASHSPVMLSLAKPEQVLCFARTGEGATDIVRGASIPVSVTGGMMYPLRPCSQQESWDDFSGIPAVGSCDPCARQG